MELPFERPKIVLEPTIADKIKTTFAFCLLMILWGFSIWIFSKAPDSVPSHFDLQGNVDRYSNKYTLLLLPLLGTIIFFVLNYLSKKPHVLNYAYSLNKDNYAAAYKNATSMLHILKLIVIILFCIIQAMVYKAIHKEASNFENILLFCTIAIIIFIPIYFSIKTFAKKVKLI